jgi:hypothetical protein
MDVCCLAGHAGLVEISIGCLVWRVLLSIQLWAMSPRCFGCGTKVGRDFVPANLECAGDDNLDLLSWGTWHYDAKFHPALSSTIIRQ